MKNTTLCYLEEKGCYLMLYRNKKKQDPNEGKWIGVGGKIEEKESPPECVLREVKEETGLTLHSYEYRGVITFVSDVYETELMHLFTSSDFTGKLTDCSEGTLQWIPVEQVKVLSLWEGDRVFLELLQTRREFFSLKLEYEKDRLVKAILDGEVLP